MAIFIKKIFFLKLSTRGTKTSKMMCSAVHRLANVDSISNWLPLYWKQYVFQPATNITVDIFLSASVYKYATSVTPANVAISEVFTMIWQEANYLTTSVAQRFVLWTLDEEVLCSSLGRSNLGTNFLIGTGLDVLDRAREWISLF